MPQADDGFTPSAWDGAAPLPEPELPAIAPVSAAEQVARHKSSMVEEPQPSGGVGAIARRVARALGVDRAIAFTVMARVWSSLAAALTIILVVKTLTRAQQGYWGVINPLVGVQIIFELGFSFVILQTASHESAHLRIHADGTIEGPDREKGRLASILQKALKWYSVAAVLLLATLLFLGHHFFSLVSARNPTTEPIHWVGPWVLAAVAASFTFQVDPIFSFLEGCGFVPEVARARFTQFVLGSLLSLTALATHHGLYAPGCMLTGQAIAGFWAIWSHRRLLLTVLRHDPGPHRTPFRVDIWPLQWRMAVSWICGYATVPLFVPVLMGARGWGPVEAGKMAVSISVASKVGDVAMAWMNTKSAPFGKLIALKRYAELDQRFFRSLLQATSIGLLGAGTVWALDEVLTAAGNHYALRFLPPVAVAMLLIGVVANTAVSSMAIYLRAHKQEKFMVNSIIGALYAAPMAWIVGHRYGGIGIAAGYAVGSLVIGLGYGTYTFLRWRRVWHSPAAEAVA
jgi:O-antigen/teichoic acid export membrane protein